MVLDQIKHVWQVVLFGFVLTASKALLFFWDGRREENTKMQQSNIALSQVTSLKCKRDVIAVMT